MPHSELYIDGVWFPSVTTIMGAKSKPWLQAWRDKWGILAERKTKIATAIGTEFHRCVESWLNEGTYAIIPPSVDGLAMPSTVARVEGMLRSWLSWANSIEGDIICTERLVISRVYTYSGTLDAIGRLNKKPIIFDWKTSNRIYDDMQLQLAAYAQAFNEEHNDVIKEGIIVCVSKDKPDFKLTTKCFKLGKRPFKQFLKLREMFDDMRAKGELDHAETADSETSGC